MPTQSNEFDLDRLTIVLEGLRNELKTLRDGQELLRDKLDSAMGTIVKTNDASITVNFNVIRTRDDITKINGKLATIEDSINRIKMEALR